jgi:hypothetical protein
MHQTLLSLSLSLSRAKQSAADNMGCPFSYAAGDVGGAFTFSNTKAFMLCVAGECGPMTSVSANDGSKKIKKSCVH